MSLFHEVLVERAGVAEEWGEMAVRSRGWIEDLGSSPRNRWHLALALYQGGDRAGSWRILQEPPALEPTTVGQARLWMVLGAYQAPNPDTADRIVALVDMFPDDKTLGEAAVGLFLARGTPHGAPSVPRPLPASSIFSRPTPSSSAPGRRPPSPS